MTESQEQKMSILYLSLELKYRIFKSTLNFETIKWHICQNRGNM